MLDFLGRLHPLILHLPIGILVISYLLEGYYALRKEELGGVRSFISLAAAVTATLSLATGLLLTRDGDYSGNLVTNHKWLAIALTSVCWALYLLSFQKSRRGFRLTMLSSMILLAATGHYGGSITHGENFLFESKDIAVKPDVNEAYVYVDLIQPILKEKCTSCHNPSKLKGELDLSTIDGIFKGGESGEAILMSDPGNSLLLDRVHLPVNVKEHMPPEGKKQLTEDEMQLLEWWVVSGASTEERVVETNGYEAHQKVVEKFLKPPEVNIFEKVDTPDSSLVSRMQSKGYKLYPVSSGSSAVYVNFLNKPSLSTGDLKGLRKLKNNIAHLNLAGSSVTDQQLKQINRFKHLQKLELQNTTISSKGVNNLGELKFLRSLNLFNTKVDSNAISKLLSFPQLRNLYLWNSQMTQEQVAQMRKEKPLLKIIYEINQDIFANARLRAPVIMPKQDLFSDSVEVEMTLNFKGVEIYYSLNDGDSILYTGPFKIGQTTKVFALAKKENWTSSDKIERTFIKSGKEINQITLGNKPHQRYSDFAKKALVNTKLGSTTFSDGEWVGYEGKHANFTLQLKEASELNSVIIGALEATGSYIFYPKGVQIEISTDGRSYEKVAESEYAIASEGTPNSRKNIKIDFEKQQAKYVRIKVFSHLENPEWHPAPGAKCWIFIDEIIIN